MTHSLAGGTGSGLGSILLAKLRETYPKHLLTAYTVFPPTTSSSCTTLEPYNAILATHALAQHVDAVQCLDNAALAHVYKQVFLDKGDEASSSSSRVSFGDMNRLAATLMVNVTAAAALSELARLGPAQTRHELGALCPGSSSSCRATRTSSRRA